MKSECTYVIESWFESQGLNSMQFYARKIYIKYAPESSHCKCSGLILTPMQHCLQLRNKFHFWEKKNMKVWTYPHIFSELKFLFIFSTIILDGDWILWNYLSTLIDIWFACLTALAPLSEFLCGSSSNLTQLSMIYSCWIWPISNYR